MSADDLLTTSDAARELHLSESGVRKAANAGQLLTKRTSNGTRVFRRQDVDDYRAARNQKARTASGDEAA
jgi:DNA-binding transcriptional MerR regulator